MTQAVKDALADAETLHLWAASLYYGPSRRYEGRGGRTASLIDQAAEIGRYLSAGNETNHSAEWRAIDSARAAFRAVPGLRG